ncbi:MAG: hypothetical protein KC618_05025, partial [Candidatus Omnitrophica bacterium]|nr:hypothetical protein [Candidatus Omnitrophota bacterium]
MDENELAYLVDHMKIVSIGDSIISNDGKMFVKVPVLKPGETIEPAAGTVPAIIPKGEEEVAFVIDPNKMVLKSNNVFAADGEQNLNNSDLFFDSYADMTQTLMSEGEPDSFIDNTLLGVQTATLRPKALDLPLGVSVLKEGDSFEAYVFNEKTGERAAKLTYGYGGGDLRQQTASFYDSQGNEVLVENVQRGKEFVKIYDAEGNYQYTLVATDTREKRAKGVKPDDFLNQRFGFARIDAEGNMQPVDSELIGYLADNSEVKITIRGELIPTAGGILNYNKIMDHGIQGGPDMRTRFYALLLDAGASPEWAETLDITNPTPATVLTLATGGAGYSLKALGVGTKFAKAATVVNAVNKMEKISSSTIRMAAIMSVVDTGAYATISTVSGQEVRGIDLFNAAKGGAKTGGLYVVALTGGGAMVKGTGTLLNKAAKARTAKALYDSKKLASLVKQRQLVRAIQGNKYVASAGMTTVGGGVNATRGVLDTYLRDGNLNEYGGLGQFGKDFGVGAGLTVIPSLGRGLLLKKGGLAKAIGTSNAYKLSSYGGVSVVGGRISNSYLGDGANFIIGFGGGSLIESLPSSFKASTWGLNNSAKTSYKATKEFYELAFSKEPGLKGYAAFESNMAKMAIRTHKTLFHNKAWRSVVRKGTRFVASPFNQRTYTSEHLTHVNAVRAARGKGVLSEGAFKISKIAQATATGTTGGYLLSFKDPELEGAGLFDSERLQYAGYGAFATTSLAALTIFRPKLHEWSRTAVTKEGEAIVRNDVAWFTMYENPELIHKMTIAGAADFAVIMPAWGLLDPVLFAAAEGTSRKFDSLTGSEKEHKQGVWEMAFEHSLRPRKVDGTRMSLW